MNKITVVGMIASKNGITLFQNTGESSVLSADNYETGLVGKRVAAGLGENGDKGVEIDLADFLLEKKVEKALEGAGIKIEGTGTDTVAIVKTVSGEEKRLEIGDNLAQAMDEVAYGDGAKGFQNFLQKLAARTCNFGSKELLTYMKANDLPIADDGSIIVYKILYKTDVSGIFVDPHTRKVTQRVGSIVTQAEEILNTSKRELCATGLHVCHGGYVSSFGGAVLTLCKVDPADVIAHDRGSAKMRVRSYHIVRLLPDCSYQSIKAGSTAAATAGRKALIETIEGHHEPAIERVLIKGLKGENLEITPIDAKGQLPKPPAPPAKPKRERKFAAEVKKAVQAISVSGIKLAELFGRKKPPVAGPDDAYEKRLQRALYLIVKQGKSIREVAPELRMDRESLGKKVIEARAAVA